MKPNRAARRAKQREWERAHPRPRAPSPWIIEDGKIVGFWSTPATREIMTSVIDVPRQPDKPFDPMGGTFAKS